jgi:hypothetical protein
MKLSVHIATDCNRAFNWLYIALFHEDLLPLQANTLSNSVVTQRPPSLTLSHSCRTSFSVRGLHAYSFSIHASRSFTNACARSIGLLLYPEILYLAPPLTLQCTSGPGSTYNAVANARTPRPPLTHTLRRYYMTWLNKRIQDCGERVPEKQGRRKQRANIHPRKPHVCEKLVSVLEKYL